ncbi:MAG TPA: quinol:electron acceptor oxidoreductase subunit ActD [Capsulimonadaceae bacterium]|nr:quinol:electron acceptor oxidoreductase subunit ActD [Capsulimonadaceae bacterium]
MAAQSDAQTTVLGLFEDIAHAADALTRLQKDSRRESDDLMVLSSVPFPEGVLEADRSKIRLPIITVVFAVIGIMLGLLLAGGSAALYVLHTGGKPILSGPPIGIIAYEVMMLVALTAAFLAALYEMRLPSWRAKVYDPRISEGLIGIAAHCANSDQAQQAEERLRAAGAIEVRRDARSFE